MTRKKAERPLSVGGTPKVNLLPPKEIQDRALKALRRGYVIRFVVTIAILAVEGVIGLVWVRGAERQQAEANEASAQLQSQLVQYSEIIGVQAEGRNLDKLRAQAAGNDQNWRPLVAEIKSVLPDAVGLVGFKVAPGAAPVPGTEASAQVGLTGTLTFSAKATSAQADTITQLRSIRGFIAVDAGELTSSGPGGGFTFVATFSADQTRYSGYFEQSGIK